MSRPQPRAVALTIAGSDSGGGAGIQADLRVFARLGVFGTSVITAVTAQNLSGVRGVTGIPADMVLAQAEAVAEGFAPRAVKTGMLWSAASVQTVAALVARQQLPAPVVDPVMVSSSGARLLEAGAVAAYERELFPRACVITPNLDEAALLLGHAIARDGMHEAVRALAARYRCPVLLKGGHLDGEPMDLLCTGSDVRAFENTRVPQVNTHGSGCTLSAAIAAKLALGATLQDACAQAIAFLHDALRAPLVLADGTRLIGIER
jgi:hydroxymethylpyrimidine/phosphomethylpyrimidine kinase